MDNDNLLFDRILGRRAMLAPEVIPPALFPLFLYYKRDRVGHESPAAVQRGACSGSSAANAPVR
jgi:hypothetical protein